MASSPISQIIPRLRRALRVRDGEGRSDGELLGEFIAGRDESAFEVLVHRHGPMVLSVCRRVVGNAHDADDAFQATFLVLVRKAASISPRNLVGNWLYGVAYRTALAARAKTSRHHAKEKLLMDMPQAEVPPDDIWQELQPLLDRELNRLPDKYRVPLVLCELEGRSRKDVARHLSLPEGTLSSRLATGRKLLAERLTRRGLAIAAGPLAAALFQNGAAACVPGPLVTSTVKAATLIAAGETAAGLVSTQVAHLTEGVLKAMLMTKLKVATVVLLLIGGAVMGGAALVDRSLAAERPRNPQAAPSPNAADAQARQPKGAASVGGTLQGVDAAKNTVTVATFDRATGRAEKTYDLAKDVVVLRDGKEAKLKDLKQGVHISAKLAADGKTVESISEMGKTLSAPLKSIDPEKNSITLTVTTGARNTPPEKKDVTHELAKDGKVTLEGKEVKLADLKDVRPGSTIQLTFSVDDEKKLLRIAYTPSRR